MKRNQGIELLRLVLMYMVCVLHSLGQGGVLDACDVGTLNYKVYWLIETLSYSAVDSFAIISGYVANNKKQRYEKIVEMWLQAFFYSFVLTLFFVVFDIYRDINCITLIECAMPIVFKKFWYFSAYFCLFFCMPILNKYIFEVDIVTAKKTFIMLFLLFSVIGVMGDPFKTSGGYSFCWLAILYCIGALARRISLFESIKTIHLVLIWSLCEGVTWGARIVLGIDELTSYISPTILISGLIVVVVFSRLHLDSKIVTVLSRLAFGVYLFQLNTIVWEEFIHNALVDVVKMEIMNGVGCVFLFALCLFIAGICIEAIRNSVVKLFRIEKCCKWIAVVGNRFIGKIVIIGKD